MRGKKAKRLRAWAFTMADPKLSGHMERPYRHAQLRHAGSSFRQVYKLLKKEAKSHASH